MIDYKFVVLRCVKIRLLLSAAGILFIVSGALAQSIQAGAEAGAAFNSNYQKNLSGYPYSFKVKSNRLSYRAGIPVVIPLGGNLRLNTGLYYAHKGITGKPPAHGFPSLVYNTLELPAALTWNRADGRRNSFFIGGGPYAGYAISNKIRWNMAAGSGKEESVAWGRDMKRWDFGAQLQLGYEFRRGWVIRMLAQRSLVNMGVPRSNANFWSYKAFSEVRDKGHFVLSAGYLFRFRSRH